MNERPLFVRLPAAEADLLDRASFETKTSKRELVATMVRRELGDLEIGHASVRPVSAPEVLTLQQAAELLQVEVATVERMAKAGELPGRQIDGEWRFARVAVLAWLSA
jgi:excisionase family DNA binding protein